MMSIPVFCVLMTVVLLVLAVSIIIYLYERKIRRDRENKMHQLYMESLTAIRSIALALEKIGERERSASNSDGVVGQQLISEEPGRDNLPIQASSEEEFEPISLPKAVRPAVIFGRED